MNGLITNIILYSLFRIELKHLIFCRNKAFFKYLKIV